MEHKHELSRLIENLPGCVYTFHRALDGFFSFHFASEGIREIYGVSPADALHDAMAIHRLIHPEDRLTIEAYLGELGQNSAPRHFEFRVHHPVKGERWAQSRVISERQPDGGVLWYGFTFDITQRKDMEDALHKRSAEYRALAENLPDVIVRYDRDCRRIYVNSAYEKTAKLSATACLGKTPLELWTIPTLPAATYQGMLETVLETGERTEIEFDFPRPEMKSICFHLTAVPEYDSNQRIVSVLTIARDITAVKETQEALGKSEREFRTLAENSPDTIARYDRDGRRRYANRKLIADMGGNLARVLGTTPIEFPGGHLAQGYMDKIREVFEYGEPRDFELHWQADGSEFCSHVRMRPELDDSGQVTQVLAVGRDITEIDQYRKKVQHQAFYDVLTALPNRALLFDRILQEIAHAERHDDWFGLMLLDLDHFKEVNDTLGHEAGDRLLCEVAQRLRAAVRASDSVARLGGDEFGVLLPEVRDKGDLNTVAGKILQALAAPILIDGSELFVSCSIGIALYPDDSVEMDALLRYADTAMYFAKKQGRNNFQFYAKELSAYSSEKLELESALRKACGKGELVLHYQPQIDLDSGNVVGAEALLRWNRSGYGMVPPERFIPSAEESGLIVDIGEWVLASACAAVADWNREREAASAAPVRMAVNVSTRQFLRNDLVGAVRRILADSGCKAEWLELEITESLLLEDSLEVARMLAELDQMGVSISIDDFGTGYSALSYLHRFPVSQIKIDKSFVQDIPGERRQCELVKAMLSIAAALQLEVVAEGVETSAQAEYLREHDCHLVQGYFYGKPMSRDAFENMLVKRKIGDR